MSEDVPPGSAPFDLERLRELIEMMEKHGLTEISLRRGAEQWRLRRGPQEVVQMVPSGGYGAGAPMAPPPPTPAPAAAAAETPATPAENTVEIKSPTVGTFYSAPSPDDPDFVTVGSRVEPDMIVCIVEAMKVFNQIPAEVSGTVTEILVKNGDSVEFGQPLFRVRPG